MCGPTGQVFINAKWRYIKEDRLPYLKPITHVVLNIVDRENIDLI